RSQLLCGVAKFPEEFGISVVEPTTNLLAEGVDPGRQRFLQMLGMAVRILGEDCLRTQGLSAFQSRRGFELDFADQLTDTQSDLLCREAFPAGQRVERQSLGRRIAKAVEVLSPLARGILLGAIEPVPFQRLALQEIAQT